ncbi:MAG: response regulator transcription factor [Actinomycetia bacterium]|nr:response regulator transcription factor [Actinomycetes bacterium]MCP4087600.1 response regulator transcription factor [Actinomycetes bacterium]
MNNPSPGAPIRVVIVDDQALMRTGFRMILESESGIEVVGEAEDGDRAIDEVRRSRPDVVLMDIRMPVLDGVEATRRLAGPDTTDPARVLILTTFDLDEYVYEAVRAGASGFLLKDTPPEDLIAAVRVIHRGEALLAPRITRTLIEEFARNSTPTSTPKDNALMSQLTDRERDVLVEMARGRSNREIADILFVGETTIKTHVGHIFTKLEARDRVQAVVAAYESGLVRPGEF